LLNRRGIFLKEKRQFEVIESRQMDHLRVFHEVARALTVTLELEDILTTIMDKMAQFFGPERWSMMLADESTQELYYAIAVGEDSESLKGLRVPMGEGVAGWVASTGNPLVVPDVALDPHWSAFSRAHPELKIQSIACVPVRSGDKTLGVIQLLNSKLDLLSEYSISFLRILCDYAAIAIQNARSMKLIQELTITDDCTGLFNSRHLYTMLDELIAQARGKRGLEFSLVFIDLDRFKQVNDTHGHLIGSRLLAEVGNLMKRCLGPDNACFRYGGDEFVALLPSMGKQAAIEATTRLWEQLRENPFLTAQGMSLSLAGSFGLATFPEDGDTVQSVIRSADTMMYNAKTTRDNISVAGMGLLVGDANADRIPARKATTMLAADLETMRR
jgi:diguanylate cyclase (GGDEF)-like protein